LNTHQKILKYLFSSSSLKETDSFLIFVSIFFLIFKNANKSYFLKDVFCFFIYTTILVKMRFLDLTRFLVNRVLLLHHFRFRRLILIFLLPDDPDPVRIPPPEYSDAEQYRNVHPNLIRMKMKMTMKKWRMNHYYHC